MDQQHLPDIAQDIQRILHKRGKDYLTIRQISASLSQRVRQQLSLTTRHATVDMLKKLTPWLGESLQVYHGPTSIYIVQKRSPAELILQRYSNTLASRPNNWAWGYRCRSATISQRSMTSWAQVQSSVPSRTIICQCSTSPPTHLYRAPPQASAEDDRLAFHTAYNAVGHGRSFVRIHRLRDALPWPRERFDGYCGPCWLTIPWNCTRVILL